MSEELSSHNFPIYPPEPLVKRAPRLDSDGIDLVSKFLLYEARKRISAKDGMRHQYFDSLGPGVHNLLDGDQLKKKKIYRLS
jgi:cyclin-dependent kinase 17